MKRHRWSIFVLVATAFCVSLSISARAQAQTTNILNSGQTLPKGGTLVSPNGTYTLTMAVDGNLILTKNGTEIWETGTSGTHVVCVMETSGDLFVNGIIPWHSGTFSPGAYLELQNDGNLVIYSAAGVQIWSTGTS